MLGYITRGLAYAASLSTAVASVVVPTSSMNAVLGSGYAAMVPSLVLPAIPIAWGLLLAVASLTCLMGVITRTWVGEYIGVGALLLCVVALGLAQISAGLILSGVLISFVLGGFLAYRWYEVHKERRHAILRFQNLQSWYEHTGRK